MEQRPLWSGVGWGRERGPTGQGSSLRSLLGADWFENLSESLSHWLLSDSGQVLCLAWLFFFPSSLNWGQHGEEVEKI